MSPFAVFAKVAGGRCRYIMEDTRATAPSLHKSGQLDLPQRSRWYLGRDLRLQVARPIAESLQSSSFPILGDIGLAASRLCSSRSREYQPVEAYENAGTCAGVLPGAPKWLT